MSGIQSFKKENFVFSAFCVIPEKARRNDPRVVDYHDVAGLEKVDYIPEYMMFGGIRQTVII